MHAYLFFIFDFNKKYKTFFKNVFILFLVIKIKIKI